MRVVHLGRSVGGGVVRPFCGEWLSMDTDWTAEPDEVTCQACRAALTRAETRPELVPSGRP
jgi:hypothetical protein